MGEAAITTLRAQATEKFRRHIERWLENTRQHIHGTEPIPHIDLAHIDLQPAPAAATAPEAAAAPTPAPAETPPEAETVVPWPAERVANG
jgi:hypothetical protein